VLIDELKEKRDEMNWENNRENNRSWSRWWDGIDIISLFIQNKKDGEANGREVQD
jgi:hypothetical protein